MENMNNQGKRPDQYENSASYSILGMIILLVIITLLGGCSITKETSKKESCCKTEKSE